MNQAKIEYGDLVRALKEAFAPSPEAPPEAIERAIEAQQRSLDPGKKVGCAVFCEDEQRVVSVGYNHLPEPYDPLQILTMTADEKLGCVLHAEAHALNELPRGYYTVTVTATPCIQCAKLMIDKGVEAVYIVGGNESASFKKRYSTDESLDALRKAGVKVHVI